MDNRLGNRNFKFRKNIRKDFSLKTEIPILVRKIEVSNFENNKKRFRNPRHKL